MKQTQNLPEYITTTIKDWQHLLAIEQFKMVIIAQLKAMIDENLLDIYCFCIMSNHVHFIWHLSDNIKSSEIRKRFFERTAQKFKALLEEQNPTELQKYRSTQKDRAYHFWKRRPLAIDLFSKYVFEQKLQYIHNNPVKAKLCSFPEDYKYSSAIFYEKGIDNFKILSHYEN
jgi:putative transposase